MIELRDVKFGYGSGMAAVDGVNLKIEDGEFVAIIGSNGAGKSTVSRLIRGLLKPEAGSVLVDGADTKDMRASALAGKMGFLFQNPDRQICKNTVMEELLFTLACAKVEKEARASLAEEMIETFGIPADADPTALSRGERQRVALMSTFVSRPATLILDEPTTGLDYRECALIMDAIAEKNRAGTTVVMVCHDMEVVLDYAKRAIVMDRGKIVGDGAPAEVFYALPRAARILPPQIIELSLALNRVLGDVSTVDEMADAIEARRGRETA